MNRTLQVLVPALLAATCAHVPITSNPAVSLARAERDFAASAQRLPINDAFLRVLADDATLFRPSPVDARESLRQRPMSTSLLLLWEPTYAEASADGTLGVTTGPSVHGQRPNIRMGTSYFLSVWRRSSRQWQLVADAGIDAALIMPFERAGATLVLRSLKQSWPDDAALAAVEDSVIADYKKQFEARAADDARVYRDGTPPTSSKEDALALVQFDDPIRFAPTRVVTASSSDLGYVIGTANPHHAQPSGYLRIYRRSAGGSWKIAFDWRN